MIEILKESDEFDYLIDEDDEEDSTKKDLKSRNVFKEVYNSYCSSSASEEPKLGEKTIKTEDVTVFENVDFIFDSIHFEQDLKKNQDKIKTKIEPNTYFKVEDEEIQVERECVFLQENGKVEESEETRQKQRELRKFKKSRLIDTELNVNPYEFPYSCALCYSPHLSTIDLFDHVQAHIETEIVGTHELTYICNFCGMAFTDMHLADLGRHSRIHEENGNPTRKQRTRELYLLRRNLHPRSEKTKKILPKEIKIKRMEMRAKKLTTISVNKKAKKGKKKVYKAKKRVYKGKKKV